MIQFILPNGMEIKCETIEEAKIVAKEFAGNIDDVLVVPPRGPGVGRPKRPVSIHKKNSRGTGSGPEESWARSLWYSMKHGDMTRNTARTFLATMKKTDPQQFYALEEEFRGWESKLGEWYGNKHKLAKEAAITELRRIGREQKDEFESIVAEFDKKKK